MKDKLGNTLVEGCVLQSDLGGKESTKITYQGDGEFLVPGGGAIYHTQESLLDSRWGVVEYPKEKKNG